MLETVFRIKAEDTDKLFTFTTLKQPKNMKRNLRSIGLALLLCISVIKVQAQRYVTEVFPSAAVTSNVIYGVNVTVFLQLSGGPLFPQPLRMDVYTPDGAPDPLVQRPLIILMHTGSFLPPVINGSPTGSKTDSTIVAMCTQFAKRGYVAAAMTYRQGWNPAAVGAAGQDIRTGTLLRAVYRAIQDAKACVRYFRANADTGGNDFGIDPNKIILGGVGTGGYIAMAYATLEDPAEINLPKFLANVTDPLYGFVAGESYVNQDSLGDFDGYGGSPLQNNPNNSPGYPNNVQFVFNMGGALGDSSWLEPGDAPIVAFHVVGDPFAPYGIGDVRVPTTGDFVVEAFGSSEVARLSNDRGNNNCFANAGFTDPLTVYANSVNNGYEGLYPFYTNPLQQAGPWEWYDSTATVAYAATLPAPYNTQGGLAYSNSLLTNPNMSKAKGLAYIDTVMGYLNPRIATCLGLQTSVQEVNEADNTVRFQPNPATARTEIVSKAGDRLIAVRVFDISGKVVFRANHIGSERFTLERNELDAGLYLVEVQTEKGLSNQRLLFR